MIIRKRDVGGRGEKWGYAFLRWDAETLRRFGVVALSLGSSRKWSDGVVWFSYEPWHLPNSMRHSKCWMSLSFSSRPMARLRDAFGIASGGSLGFCPAALVLASVCRLSVRLPVKGFWSVWTTEKSCLAKNSPLNLQVSEIRRTFAPAFRKKGV